MAALQGLWDLSSLTRDWTQDSAALDHQRMSRKTFYYGKFQMYPREKSLVNFLIPHTQVQKLTFCQ